MAVAVLCLAVAGPGQAAPRILLAQAAQPATETLSASTARAVTPDLLTPLSRDAAITKQTLETLLEAGDVSAGRDLFSSYLAAAPAITERATLSLAYGNALAKTAKQSSQPALLEEAGTYLRYSFEHGSHRERIIARNNYAAIALQQERIDEAMSTLDQGYETAKRLTDRAAQARYLFNYGRMVERHADPNDALTLYREAYLADPRRPQAAEAGVDLALRLGVLPAAAVLLQGLVVEGHPAAAEPYLKALTGEPALAGEPTFTAIVEVFYDYLPAARVEPARFAKVWRAPLQRMAPDLAREAAERLDLVFLAYDPEPPIIFDSYQVRARYAPWFGSPEDSRGAAEILARPSQFLTAMGEIHADLGRLGHALALYAAAWAMNTANLDAGLYAASLLLEYPEELDPEGRYLRRFISNLFAGKGEAYIGDDLPNILRFHTILGTIFSNQERWGDSGTVESAIFQWENALRASRRLAQQGRTEEAAAPGLHAKLADAYDAVGRRSDAFDSYLRAADEALRIGNDELARGVLLTDIEALSYSPSAEQRQRLEDLRSKISG
jgi:tetratricopeptide (TPR) repeat protein